LELRQILGASALFSEHGPACQPAGNMWSTSQALASGLAALLSVFYWETSFYPWSTWGRLGVTVAANHAIQSIYFTGEGVWGWRQSPKSGFSEKQRLPGRPFTCPGWIRQERAG